MSDEQEQTVTETKRGGRRTPPEKTAPIADTSNLTDDFVPDWAQDFDNEDYPDMVVVGEGERLFFRILASNIIPLVDKRTNDLVDTEVVQIEVMPGTNVRDKTYDDDGRMTPLDTFVQPKEVRTLWINAALLRKIWEEWDPEIGDEGAVAYKGKVNGRNNGYHKWMGKFNKTKPIRASVTR